MLDHRVNAPKEPDTAIQVNKLPILYIDLGQVTSRVEILHEISDVPFITWLHLDLIK